ncbi:MAG: hypothetical protein O2854_06385 [Chloroflexi bacterium]|nr:hypothetical protein [Chloroflexota bacterium]
MFGHFPVASVNCSALSGSVVRSSKRCVEEGGKIELPCVAEKAQRLVVDWNSYEESAPANFNQLEGSLEQMEQRIGKETIKAVGRDRGFGSQANRERLKEKEMFN